MKRTSFYKKLLGSTPRLLTAVAAVVVIAASGGLAARHALAATGFYFAPSSGSFQTGDNVVVSVREDSGSQRTNVVALKFSYPANILQYVSTDLTGSNFPVPAGQDGGNGTVSLQQGAYQAQTGDQLIARVTFKAVGAGTANLAFSSDSTAVSYDDNKTNVDPTSSGAAYSVAAAPNPNPNPNPSPNPSPAPNPTPAPRPTTTYTPSNTTEPIPTGNNDQIQIETPVDIQPATIQPDGVSKIEYSLNHKLVATVTQPPYRYHLDTTKLLNGTYIFTTKTYYQNGQTETSSQTLIVKNPFGPTQLKLLAGHYLWLILLLLVIAAAIGAWLLYRKRRGGGSGFHPGSSPHVSDGATLSSPPPSDYSGTTPPPSDYQSSYGDGDDDSSVIRPASAPPRDATSSQAYRPEAVQPSEQLVRPSSPPPTDRHEL